jgi:hypothetical protein
VCGYPAGGSGSVASAASAAHDRFGIRLLEAPASRRNDPRARTYIVDHVLPGTVIHRRVEVSNTSGALLRPQLYAAAAAVQNGTFGLAPGRTRNELSDWISVDRPAVELPPHSVPQPMTTIKVPRQASAGASILARALLIGAGGVVTLVAEAYGNRTRRRRWASTSGFEDQEGHQAPSRLHGSP